MKKLIASLILLYAVNGSGRPQTNRATDMNAIAESYVKLVLSLGQHDPDYVDAFYGPPEWKTEAQSAKKSLQQIKEEATRLQNALKEKDPVPNDELVRLRHQYLTKQIGAMIARSEMLAGKKLSFDEETKALYDVVAPPHDEKHFEEILAEIQKLLPGDGALSDRYVEFRKNFIIPPDKLDTVFTAAINECRRRTKAHVALPDGESFRVEYVKGKSWSGYNWYQGNFHSLIQVNTDLPIYIDRAIDLAGHEGYPGHHVYNSLLEYNLVKKRGWIEFSVYPLFSPQSLIAEGTANFGVDVVMPGEERLNFEKITLFPLAGLDPARAKNYYAIQKLVSKLDYVSNFAARRYLNSEIDRDQAAALLVRYGLMAPERAKQRVRFIDQYRSYVINYNLGQDLVRNYIESRGGTEKNPEVRWREFSKLLSSPRLPSGLTNP